VYKLHDVKFSGSRKIHNIKAGNRSFENVAEFEYLGIALTDQNCKV
jgi:hypothetical protein